VFNEFAIQLSEWLVLASQHPAELYFVVITLLILSSFGLPIPEEIVLLTSGTIAHLALLETSESGLPPTVNPITLAWTCFFAVLLSDLLVFSLGRRLGPSFLSSWPANLVFTRKRARRISYWTEKYGALACGIFRFTPGFRFPGHFMCGAIKISYSKFLLIDGLAALISVPTQIYLVAYYGDDILRYVKTFKVAIFLALVAAILSWFAWKVYKRSTRRTPRSSLR